MTTRIGLPVIAGALISIFLLFISKAKEKPVKTAKRSRRKNALYITLILNHKYGPAQSLHQTNVMKVGIHVTNPLAVRPVSHCNHRSSIF